MELELNCQNIDKQILIKMIEYLEKAEYNETYILHLLENVDKEVNPIEYFKHKFPDAEL